MTDLDELDIPTPRPDALCKQFVRRLDPWLGYALAAALLALGGAVVGVLALITLSPMLGIVEKSTAAKVAAIVALVLGELLAYVIFTRWRRVRMERKRTLIRDGVLAEATVTGSAQKVEKGRTDISLDVRGGPLVRCQFNFWFEPAPGATVRVLWLPLDTSPHLLAFDASGRMYSGHIKSVARKR